MLSIPPRLPSVHNLRRAFELLDANLLAAEPELNSTRWPGHIGDPIKLNLEFLTLYNEARREALAHSFKNSLARRSKNDAPILTANSFRNAVGVSQEAYHGGKDKGGNIVHIHKLRQFADSTGLPYQRFIKVCLEFGLGGGSKWVPLPFTMLGSPKTRVVLARKLDFEMRENLPCMLRRFYARNPNAGSIERLPSGQILTLGAHA